jgi:Tfp pilus assembly protein PilF
MSAGETGFCPSLFQRGLARQAAADLRGAIADYTRALLLDPNMTQVYYHRAEARAALGDQRGAMEDFNRVQPEPRRCPPPVTAPPVAAEQHFQAALTHMREGQTEQAIARLTEALRLFPQHGEAYFRRGWLRFYLGDNRGALEDYHQALQWLPKRADIYYQRGLTRYRLGDKQGAVQDYTQAIALQPDFADAYYNRSIAYRRMGYYTEAVKDHNQALRLNPNFAYVHGTALNPTSQDAQDFYEVGNSKAQKGDFQGAISDYNQS